jgi:hypothetical protein
MDRSAQDSFVHRENLERYRKLLLEQKEPTLRQLLLKLLAEEAAKERHPPGQA